MKIIASRLSGGNKLFPASISITEQGVTLKVPGFFSGSEQTIAFDQISAVDIETPFVGYSSIKIKSIGWNEIIASGFTKSDVIQIKKAILDGQKKEYTPQKSLETSYNNSISKVIPQIFENDKEVKEMKWAKELREMKELLECNVISTGDYEEQKLKLMGTVELEEGVALSEALWELRDLRDEKIISEEEFQILKLALMNN